MTCNEIRKAMAAYETCVETDAGSRVVTHCLYPSFEPVCIFVQQTSRGFRVHDGGGAFRSGWDHGRDAKLMRKMATRQAAKYRVSLSEGSFFLEVTDAEWLPSAIIAIANASSAAACAALDRIVAITEGHLKDQILTILKHSVPPKTLTQDYEQTGKSGKIHHFDFAIKTPERGLLLIDAVAPHHVSISAKYVAFADMTEKLDGKIEKFAVHDRPLDPSDISLLQQVADIVPVNSLEPGIKRMAIAQ